MRHYTISTLLRGEIWYNLHMAVAKIEYKKEFFDRDYTLKEAYGRVWKYARKYRLRLAVGVICGMATPTKEIGPERAVTAAERRLDRLISANRNSLTFTPMLCA